MIFISFFQFFVYRVFDFLPEKGEFFIIFTYKNFHFVFLLIWFDFFYLFNCWFFALQLIIHEFICVWRSFHFFLNQNANCFPFYTDYHSEKSFIRVGFCWNLFELWKIIKKNVWEIRLFRMHFRSLIFVFIFVELWKLCLNLWVLFGIKSTINEWVLFNSSISRIFHFLCVFFIFKFSTSEI